MEERYTIKEASSIVGVSEYTIRRRILDGTIVANKILGKYIINMSELDKYKVMLEEGVGKLYFFDNYGKLKQEYVNKENELLCNKMFIEEVKCQVYSSRSFPLESDIARIYYLLMREVENCE